MRKLLTGLCVGLGLLLVAVAARAAPDEKRIALVVGVASYSNAPPLLNPTKDAQAIADALRKLGFEVDLKLDLDNRALSSALRGFGVRAADADVALVYFAGHGVQVDGTNYLIPADAKLERVRDLLYEAVPLQLFLGEISQAHKLGIMLLDACRDNPFVDRLAESMGAARTNRIGLGLNRIDDTPSGTMVAMATRANVVAEDGTGEHSPYAEALLTELQVPGARARLVLPPCSRPGDGNDARAAGTLYLRFGGGHPLLLQSQAAEPRTDRRRDGAAQGFGRCRRRWTCPSRPQAIRTTII